jgi:hypothetical protein
MIVVNDGYFLETLYCERDGALMVVRPRFVSRSDPSATMTYERAMPPAEYGEWTHGFLRVTDSDTNVRIRMDDGIIIGIGHPTEDLWFDPRAPHEVSYTQKQAALVEKALLHINRHRARHAIPDLNATGWEDSDIFMYAHDLGWSERT